MPDPIPYLWGDTLPYNSLTERFKENFGGRVQKVSLRAGFTCPNRDGRVGRGGCTFCNNEAFVPSYTRKSDDIWEQIEEGIPFLSRLYKRTALFVAYFQAYTNTYGSLDQLKELYNRVLSHPRIGGLVIGTRPDCVEESLLDYLSELARNHFIQIEYGIESCYDDVLASVNRGHNYECAQRAVQISAGRGLHVGAHFIFGFPGDSPERMLAQADQINALPLDSVKFHQLQIVKGTAMAEQYARHPEKFDLFSQEEYMDFIIAFLERLRPTLSVDRLCSEVPPPLQVAPIWSGQRLPELHREIVRKMVQKGAYQGRLFRG